MIDSSRSVSEIRSPPVKPSSELPLPVADDGIDGRAAREEERRKENDKQARQRILAALRRQGENNQMQLPADKISPEAVRASRYSANPKANEIADIRDRLFGSETLTMSINEKIRFWIVKLRAKTERLCKAGELINSRVTTSLDFLTGSGQVSLRAPV